MSLTQASEADEAGVEFAEVVTWLRKHQVSLVGLLLVAASVVWKAQFLYRRYFYQDDFVDLDIARRSGFSWHYLGLVGDDHFFPGLRAITWVLARTPSLYNWALDSTVLLIFAAAASLAALRVLRTLFGDRPAILFPLVIYLVLPLTVPDFGWWWTGMEALPLQLAIFMTLNAHVLYVRTGRWLHLGAAVGWLIFGLLFFEKGVVLPLLLFGITSAFCVDARSWLGGMARTVRQHWPAWLCYAVVLIGYAFVTLAAFRASRSISHPATSISAVRTFTSYFVRDNLLPGLFGGPWHWFDAGPGSRYAIALPSSFMVTVSEIAAAVLLVVNLWVRPVAWRAWTIFATWVVADMATVIVGRLGFGLTVFFALDTRYLVDAAPVFAVCFGLACLPVAGTGQRAATVQRVRRRLSIGIDWRLTVGALVAVFVLSAIWSDQGYQNLTNGAPAVAAYVANADRAVTHAAPGTFIIDQAMPTNAILPTFGAQANQSQIIGLLAKGKQARRLHWITQAVGTIDNLKMFGGDGHLLPALVSGAYSVPRTGRGLKSCWPYRHRRIVVRFTRPTAPFAQTLHIGYIWGGGAPGFLVVRYGESDQRLYLTPGVHSAYLSVAGSVTKFAIDGARGRYLCVGVSASGKLVPF